MSEKKPAIEMPQNTNKLIQKISFFILGVFLVSPLIQFFLIVFQVGNFKSELKRYQGLVLVIHVMAAILAFTVFCIYINIKKPDSVYIKKNLNRLLPFIFFVLFAFSILSATIIRVPNEYDLSGHPYLYESIWFYMTYALAYFFFGTIIASPKQKKTLLYIFIFSSLIMNLLEMYSEWVVKLQSFGNGTVENVFYNSNHYGYYLVLTSICTGLLFVYEDNKKLKRIDLFAYCVSIVILLINNTLGAYLAIAFALMLHCWFCHFVKKNKKLFKLSLIILAIFLAISIFMSFFYDSILRSILRTFVDIGNIMEDPAENDSAGSGRWILWKQTMKGIGERPLFGWGVEGLLSKRLVGTPHNELMQYAAFFGIPTMLLYTCACFLTLYKVAKKRAEMDYLTVVCWFVSLGYLVSSLVGVAVFYTTPFVYIFLGLTYSQYFHMKEPVAAGEENV